MAEIGEEDPDTSDDEKEANAHLIAAAPELLEAAIELKDVCNRPSAARTRAEAWRKLDKAIAKALQPNWSLTHKESGEILGTVEK
jgi:type VI protein secretion system component VasF